ncbi:AAA family ATPase [Photobacterium andalusiense]|uniref:5-methylcytosine-specific restriction enzyme B n=1 Tax=Photobacterium andalusiense TaxID=2204296 RepID=A0A1Y6MEM8_9GAMM|nr:AAA family ATPase [Photobacterium andalusiense]SMY34932.1 5-methylcytosine-specific restriction enzyme B [Photobacterium andalusiense]
MDSQKDRASKHQQLWNDFLRRWPRENLNQLTLEEYVSVNDQDTFTYWLETKTRELGSIQGNTSAKFGIYKRNGEGKEQNGIGHGEIYTWRTRYGNNEFEVFNYVKNVLIQISKAAYDGNLAEIDSIDFAPLIKWKIAFLYQNQDSPVLINTFSKPMLEVLTNSNSKTSFPSMYQRLITEKGEQNLLQFGDECWDRVAQKSKEIHQKSILDKFSHIDVFNRGVELWSPEIVTAFCDLIQNAYDNKLDVFTITRTKGAMIRVGRKELGASRAEEVFATFEPTLQEINYALRYQHRDGYECSTVTNELYLRTRKSKKQAEFSQQYPITRKPYWPESYFGDSDADITYDDYKVAEQGESYTMTQLSPLNQILYGPPGTGKTFYTMEAAVKAAEPDFIWTDRIQLKAEYERLVSEKRIRFVTFHQSYGYEEFVEGLSAKTSDNGQLTYPIKDGIFKSICKTASVSEANINFEGTVWKISIEGTYENESKKYCLDNNIAAIGWGDTGDLSFPERNDYFNNEGKNNRNSLTYFSQNMKVGDLVVCIDSKTSVEAVGVVTGSYQYVESGLASRNDYCHHLPVNWFAKEFSVDFKELNDDTAFNLPTCYPLSRLSVSDVLNHLKEHGVHLEKSVENYALVIDEINRGNISKIFGELITLIEPSKRKGAEEALEVTLPYSGDTFSVPDNLYIIGTMNTADRSLALMDTALRRRFDFVEMMPKPELFEHKTVKNIDLTELLTTLNKRIEVLYDREHTLGHAFLFPAYNEQDEDKAFELLKAAFKNKIIPLLEEYFFDDWNKIRLVLGDNQKQEALRFITEQKDSYESLFGANHGLNIYEDAKVTFQLALFDGNDSVWDQPEAYIAIYTKG